jgi:hypothetical protein
MGFEKKKKKQVNGIWKESVKSKCIVKDSTTSMVLYGVSFQNSYRFCDAADLLLPTMAFWQVNYRTRVVDILLYVTTRSIPTRARQTA